jgi:hypothetical protein
MNSKQETREMFQYIKDMLFKGIICPWNLYFASPVLLAKKESEETRVCIDYSQLMNLVDIDAYPLPLMEQLITNFLQSKYFSKKDLKATYN